MKIRITPSIKSAVAAIVMFGAVIGLRADTITVTNTNDSGPGSLRQALADASEGDTIDFAVTGTIGLTSGELLVSKSITIAGPGADDLAVNGNAKSRVFHIAPDTTVTITGLTITNGNASGNHPDDLGGGIYNDHAMLTLSNCTISDNSAGGGGGIYNDGTFGNAALQITNSILSGNSATDDGGGIWSQAPPGMTNVQISNSTLSENSAGNNGGGIFNNGGLGTPAILEIANTTFFDNSAQSSGGGIYNRGLSRGHGTTDLVNTILETGKAGGSIFNDDGAITSHGYNLSSDNGGGHLTGPGDQINTDPLLGPLEDNGGPTFTHELLAGSPAIDAGDPNFTPPPLFDQRGSGFDRVVNGRLDIGSFEVQGSTPPPSPTPTPSATPRVTPRLRPAPHTRPTPR